MAAYDTLRAAIDSYIKANGNKEITGTVLNDILNAMVSALGADTRFAGVAVPSTNPGNPEGNVVYFASQAGTYSNFGGIVLPLGIHILVWNGTAWTSQTWFSVDNTPTQNSQNLATSGGIFQAIVDAVGVERLRAIGAEVTSCSFDSNTKKISFFNSENTTLFQLDATAFVIDGMVSDVKIEGGNLVIQFNTDAGKQDIEIPLTDIFNPANYYTKTAIDALFSTINSKLGEGFLYKGIATSTTVPGTPTTKVFYITSTAGTYTNFLDSNEQPIVVDNELAILKFDGTNWNKDTFIDIDNEPTAGSDNLVKSEGVNKQIYTSINNEKVESILDINRSVVPEVSADSWENGNINDVGQPTDSANYTRMKYYLPIKAGTVLDIVSSTGDVNKLKILFFKLVGDNYTFISISNYGRLRAKVPADATHFICVINISFENCVGVKYNVAATPISSIIDGRIIKKSNLKDSNIINGCSWEIGSLSDANGSEINSIHAARSGFIDVANVAICNSFKLENNSDGLFRCEVYFYSTNNVSGFIGHTAVLSGSSEFAVPTNTRYIRFWVDYFSTSAVNSIYPDMSQWFGVYPLKLAYGCDVEALKSENIARNIAVDDKDKGIAYCNYLNYNVSSGGIVTTTLNCLVSEPIAVRKNATYKVVSQDGYTTRAILYGSGDVFISRSSAIGNGTFDTTGNTEYIRLMIEPVTSHAIRISEVAYPFVEFNQNLTTAYNIFSDNVNDYELGNINNYGEEVTKNTAIRTKYIPIQDYWNGKLTLSKTTISGHDWGIKVLFFDSSKTLTGRVYNDNLTADGYIYNILEKAAYIRIVFYDRADESRVLTPEEALTCGLQLFVTNNNYKQTKQHILKVGTWNCGWWNNGVTPGSMPDNSVDAELPKIKTIATDFCSDIFLCTEYLSALNKGDGGRDVFDAYNTVFKQFYPYAEYDGRQYAMLSKMPCIYRRIWSSTGSVFITGDFDIEGKKVRVICLHAVTNATYRLTQLQEAINYLSDVEYGIIVGDFNIDDTAGSSQVESELALFATAGLTLGNRGYWGNIPTGYNQSEGGLDNVAVKGFNIDKFIVGEEKSVSDHYPVLAELSAWF